jgi:uncharacterized protein YbjT (DUF2867 family)
MQKQILVVGGTGHLGKKVIEHLLKQDVVIRALVRPGSDASELEKKGVKIFRGDMTEPETLPAAMENADAVITTAIGYMSSKKGDSLASVDDIGNRNLVDAAAKMKIPRFVFTSILTADKAQSVPHFWQKKLIEDYLRQKGVPFVALRPGAFIDQSAKADFWAPGLLKGKLSVLGSTKAKWSYILTDDLARYLALAAVKPEVPSGTIDIATDEPMNTEQLAQYASEYAGHTVKLSSMPWPVMRVIFGLIGLFNPWMADLKKMLDYFFTGEYIADTSLQKKVFGRVPGTRESVFRYFGMIGLKKK